MSHTELQLDALNSQNLLVMQLYADRAAVASAVAKANAKTAAKAAKAGLDDDSDGESESEGEAESTAVAAPAAEFDGWLERIDQMAEFDAEQLTRLHGQLIAMGFLKFEISGRSVGLRYKISTRGKNALDRATAMAARLAAGDDSEDDGEEIEMDFADAA